MRTLNNIVKAIAATALFAFSSCDNSKIVYVDDHMAKLIETRVTIHDGDNRIEGDTAGMGYKHVRIYQSENGKVTADTIIDIKDFNKFRYGGMRLNKPKALVLTFIPSYVDKVKATSDGDTCVYSVDSRIMTFRGHTIEGRKTPMTDLIKLFGEPDFYTADKGGYGYYSKDKKFVSIFYNYIYNADYVWLPCVQPYCDNVIENINISAELLTE